MNQDSEAAAEGTDSDGAAAPSDHEKQARQWAMFLHLSQFAGYVIPFAGYVVPILLWQMKKEEFPEIDKHGKIVINWIISALIYGLISFVATFVLVGFLTGLVLAVLCIVYPIIGGIKANSGETWNYPGAIPFLK